MNIAIVDDIAEERTVLRDRLVNQFNRRSTQIDIYEYANGEDFLSNFRNKNIAIVFLDIYMSGANGIEIAKNFETSTKNASSYSQPHLLTMHLKDFKYVPRTIL